MSNYINTVYLFDAPVLQAISIIEQQQRQQKLELKAAQEAKTAFTQVYYENESTRADILQRANEELSIRNVSSRGS